MSKMPVVPEVHHYRYPRAANTSSVVAWAYTYDHQHHRNGLEILGILRGGEPFRGMLALPGGFHEVDKETLEETAARELREETGIDAVLSDFRLVCVQSSLARDPREHVIDHVYSVALPPDVLHRARAGDDAAGLQYVGLKSANSLDAGLWAFDHGNSLEHFLKNFQWDRIGVCRYLQF
jgi:ADP-ribose pyrophosphatase YjhB (NUDIX family)